MWLAAIFKCLNGKREIEVSNKKIEVSNIDPTKHSDRWVPCFDPHNERPASFRDAIGFSGALPGGDLTEGEVALIESLRKRSKSGLSDGLRP